MTASYPERTGKATLDITVRVRVPVAALERDAGRRNHTPWRQLSISQQKDILRSVVTRTMEGNYVDRFDVHGVEWSRETRSRVISGTGDESDLRKLAAPMRRAKPWRVARVDE